MTATRSVLEFRRPHRPVGVRVANLAGTLVTKASSVRRVGPLDLDEGSLLAAAARTARATDFGDETLWRPALRALLASLESESRLTPVGRWCARGQLLGCLVNRLRMERDWARDPSKLERPVRRPLVVLGLPRSGTTLLQNLLAQDLANRSLLQWEASTPSPPPQSASYDTDPRIARATSTMRVLDYLAPSARALHPVGPRLPTECVTLFANSFASLELAAINWTPGYLAWCLSADMRPHYAYYRRQLQLLQSGHRAERWALKSPAHLFWLDVLLETFPDAAVVQLHRDPVEVIGSYCSLVSTLVGVGSDQVDVAAIGATWSRAWADGLDRATRARTAATVDTRVYDVHYRDLVADPVSTVRRLYARFDLPYSPEFDAAMRAFLAANPQHKGGVHRYSLEQFGLDHAAETARYATYRARYGV
jgi:hypothetical protein